MVKVSEASGAVLNWMVATALGRGPKKDMGAFGGVWRVWWLSQGGEYERMPDYCGDWAQGGPIIEREGIDLYCNVPTNMAHDDPAWRGSWRAKYHRCGFGTEMSYGPTPLIAAMRCYVTSKLGDTVEVPKEIIHG